MQLFYRLRAFSVFSDSYMVFLTRQAPANEAMGYQAIRALIALIFARMANPLGMNRKAPAFL
jgi:hypothetical protein